MFKKKESREYTEYEKKMNEYYWKCFISEFSKICIFFIIFLLLRLTAEYFVALFFLLLLRNHGGGLHFKHYTSCLIISFSFLYGSILLAQHIMPPKSIICITCLLCILMGYYLVPVTSSNRPPATPDQVKRSKRNTTVIITLFSFVICICPCNTYLNIGYWTMILHIFQLILSHINKEVTKYVRLGN